MWLFWFYVIIACIWIFITVFIDIFRDSTLNGWGKALWVIFLVFVPFLAAFIYLIARGRGMAERNAARAAEAQAANADYIRTRGRIVIDHRRRPRSRRASNSSIAARSRRRSSTR